MVLKNFDKAQQEVQQWILDFVEKPNPLLNDWPPCPYARNARLKDKVDLRAGIQNPLVDTELVEMGRFDVLGYIYDADQFTADEFNKLVRKANQDFLKSRDMIALADHPDDYESVNGVCMNQGTYAIMFLQKLSELNHFAKLLSPKGFYDSWHEEYLQVLFEGRQDPRV